MIKTKHFIILFICLFCLPFIAYAAADDKSRISAIHVFVVLDEHGNGYVTEAWDMEVYDGTENYKQIFDLTGGESITGFMASENGVDYEFLDKWNVEAGRREKINKCGVVSSNRGVELCWGIGAENGRHIYMIRYVINRMAVVEAGTGKAVLYWKFIPEKFQYAENVFVTVTMPREIDDSYNFWIFGFDGQISIKANEYIIKADHVETGHFVELALVMPASDFPLAQKSNASGGSDGSRLARVLKNGKSGNELGLFTSEAPANKINAYEDKFDRLFNAHTGLFIALMIIMPMGSFFLMIFLVLKLSSAHNLKTRIKKHVPAADMPRMSFEGIAYLLSALKYSPDVLNTYMIKWIYRKNFEITSSDKKLFFTIYKTYEIKLNSPPEAFDGELERMCFELVNEAFAGASAMDSGELSEYISKNSSKQRAISDFMKKTDVEYCRRKGWMYDGEKMRGSRRKYLTPDGESILDGIFGFASYLWNLSSAEKDRQTEEQTELYDSYLAFANLMGIAREVRNGFKKIIPLYEEKSETHVYMDTVFYSALSVGSVNAPSSSGSSGSGSSGGGGGGSGGGGGGGTR